MTATPIDFQTDVLISGGAGYAGHFVFTAPTTRPYKVSTAGGTGDGDFDLMVRIGAEAVGDPDYIYDYGSFNGGSDESVEFLATAGDEVYILVERYTGDIVDLVLRADTTEGEVAGAGPTSASLSGPTKACPPLYTPRRPAYGVGGWLAGNGTSSYFGPSHLLRSADGTVWTGQVLIDGVDEVRVEAVAPITGGYVVVFRYRSPAGAGAWQLRVGRSTDGGDTWSIADPLTATGLTSANLDTCTQLRSGGGVLVMLVDSGKAALRSADEGVTWSKVAISTWGAGLYSNPRLLYHGGKFVSNSGDNGQQGVYTSPTGTVWTREGTGSLIAWGASLASDGTTLWTSTATNSAHASGTSVTTLTARTAPTYANPAFWDGTHFVVPALTGGNSGTALLQYWTGSAWGSKPLPPLQLKGLPELPMEFIASGAGTLAATYRLESTNGFFAARIVPDTPAWTQVIADYREFMALPSGSANWLATRFVPAAGYHLNSDRMQPLINGPQGLLYSATGRGAGLLPPGGAPLPFRTSPFNSTLVCTLHQGKYLINEGGGYFYVIENGAVTLRICATIISAGLGRACSNGSRAIFINTSSNDEHVYTDDGVTFTEFAMGFVAVWWSVIWYRGYFHAFGYDGAHARSPTGAAGTWTLLDPLPVSGGYPTAVTDGERLSVLFHQPNNLFVTDDGEVFRRVFGGFPAGEWAISDVASFSAGCAAVPVFKNGGDGAGPNVLVSIDLRTWVVPTGLPASSASAPWPYLARFSAVAPVPGGFAISNDHQHSVIMARAAVGKFWTGFIACEESA